MVEIRLKYLLFLMSILLLAAVGFIWSSSSFNACATCYPNKPTMSPGYIMQSPCGSTAAEARDRGCNFDIMSFCWLPDNCYDAELSEDFENISSWEWFLDPNKSQPVAYDEVMKGELTGLYVSWEYHLRHCTAMWKKMHRAVLGKGKIAVDSYIGDLGHTEHCGHQLLEDRDVGFDEINTAIFIKFPDCGIV